jgi:hypothetical protein
MAAVARVGNVVQVQQVWTAGRCSLRGLRNDRMTAEVEMAGGIDGIVDAARLTLN